MTQSHGSYTQAGTESPCKITGCWASTPEFLVQQVWGEVQRIPISHKSPNDAVAADPGNRALRTAAAYGLWTCPFLYHLKRSIPRKPALLDSKWLREKSQT